MRSCRDSKGFLKLIIIGDSLTGKSCLLRRFVDNQFGALDETKVITGTQYIECRNNRQCMLRRGQIKRPEFQHIRCLSEFLDRGELLIQIYDGWTKESNSMFLELESLHYGGTDAILFVYDITQRSSFETLKKSIADSMMKMNRYNQHVRYGWHAILVGTKYDLSGRSREVSLKEAQHLARSIRIGTFPFDAFVTLVASKPFRNCVCDFERREIFQVIHSYGGNWVQTIETSAKDAVNVNCAFAALIKQTLNARELRRALRLESERSYLAAALKKRLHASHTQHSRVFKNRSILDALSPGMHGKQEPSSKDIQLGNSDNAPSCVLQ